MKTILDPIATHQPVLDRRRFLGQAASVLAGSALLPRLEPEAFAGEAAGAIRFGACVVGLEQARQAGLDGVEVGVGDGADRLEIADPAVRQRYKEQMRQTGLPVCSLMMGLLNSHRLASDPRAPAWLEQAIDAAHDLGARVVLVAFFGNGDLLDAAGKVKEADVDVAVRRLKAAAPRAKDAGVILAIENYLDGSQNARILDRINHEAVQVYYDVYNTGVTKGHDVPGDIQLLKERIVQFHFKNGPDYLDNGKLKFGPIATAMKKIGYRGWIVLETSSPSKDAVADARRNTEFARGLFK
ncbi:MAG TPA: sugar phosphate isomerase/epimerase family protein [Verrucomicrobiota bacterium]|nr:sugar phosphate isomerase/epimerase family protein [Verrucomicrobiota bacterium]